METELNNEIHEGTVILTWRIWKWFSWLRPVIIGRLVCI